MPERPSVIKRSDEEINSFNASLSIAPENTRERLGLDWNIFWERWQWATSTTLLSASGVLMHEISFSVPSHLSNISANKRRQKLTLRVSFKKKKKKGMTEAEKMTERWKTRASCRRGSKRKTLNSCFLLSLSLCSFPGESHVISLILVCGWQRGPRLCSSPRSHGSVPSLIHTPSPRRRSTLPGGEGCWGAGELHHKERRSQWVLVSSRPLHLARWDFVYTHTCTHTSMRRQMTINGLMNAIMGCCSCFFFLPSSIVVTIQLAVWCLAELIKAAQEQITFNQKPAMRLAWSVVNVQPKGLAHFHGLWGRAGYGMLPLCVQSLQMLPWRVAD